MDFRKAAAECRADLEKVERGLLSLREKKQKDLADMQRICQLDEIRMDLRILIRQYNERVELGLSCAEVETAYTQTMVS